MWIFKNDPSTPRNYKNVVITVIVAVAIFSVIMVYLVPQIVGEPFHTLVKDGMIVLAILFLVDLIW